MPRIETSIDFEVFCDECGAGLCNGADVRESRTRAMPQLVVVPCPDCIQAAKDEASDNCESVIEGLRMELAEVEARLRQHETEESNASTEG